MCRRVPGIQPQGSLKSLFRGLPVAFEGECEPRAGGVSLGERRIQPERDVHGLARAAIRLGGHDVPVIPQDDVDVRQTGVREREPGIAGDGVLKQVGRLLQILSRAAVPVEPAA